LIIDIKLVFRKKKENDSIELPDLKKLEKWVIQVIAGLELKDKTYTILPAFGGIIIYIQKQGIAWIPYGEIKTAEGKVDKKLLLESTAMAGGAAVVASTGGVALPILFVPGFLKKSYRVIAKPSPKKSMSFLHSMINKVVIQERKADNKIRTKLENSPFIEDDSTNLVAYTLIIYRKYLDKEEELPKPVKFMKDISSAILGNTEPIFAIPSASDVKAFTAILEKQGINVEWIELEIEENEINENQ